MPIPALNPVLDFLLNAEAMTLIQLGFLCLAIVVALHFLGKYLENKKRNLLSSFVSIIAAVSALLGILFAIVAFFNYGEIEWLWLVPNFMR